MFLTSEELAKGLDYLLRSAQVVHFTAEIKALQSNKQISRSSSTCRLSPFLDDHGLLRVGGRLQNSFRTYDEKHPIILDTDSHVAYLLVQQAHQETCHGGVTLVQSHISRRYWLIRGRNFVRKIIRLCITCARHQGQVIHQQMGQLPEIRAKPSRPFTCTGLDYAGPFLMKASAGRGRVCFKGYIAIFVCLVTRAVHIEVASDLTTKAFLAAFKRFAARRGLPKLISSDNALNFQGADAELKKLFHETSEFSQEVAAAIAKDGVQWSFIPPRAPNFGGLWETNVRSFKRHFYKVIGENKLTFEEFTTVAATIEACMNSRPLSAMSLDPGDLSALTPGHFLIGSEIISPPEPFEETNETPTMCSRWHLLTLMRNHFWKRWRQECLYQLQERSKWLFPTDKVVVGDLVLFKDENHPPTKWPLGRIIHLYDGPDNLKRVARIRTSAGEYCRALNKLVKLPVNDDARSHLAKN